MARRRLAVIATAVAWSGFVWISRIRNALADDELQGAGLAAVVALSLSFLVLALAVAVAAWRERRGGSDGPLKALVVLNLVWSSVVWAVRIVDIALGGDHEIGFIVVHVALGVISVVLWSFALVVVAETDSTKIPVRG